MEKSVSSSRLGEREEGGDGERRLIKRFSGMQVKRELEEEYDDGGGGGDDDE
jgi:hypothetical protein